MPATLINSIKHELLQPLPGIEVQFEMAHINRSKLKPEDFESVNYRQSAVLVLIYKKAGRFYIPLTERHVYKGAHSGQVSLPGGKFEEQDQTLENTALRECNEEIGLKNNIEILGTLTPVYIPVSGFVVNVFVGFLNENEQLFAVNDLEVKNLIELDLNDLINPDIIKYTTVEPEPGLKLKTPYFDVQGKVIWGATAMILNEFKNVLQKTNLI